jgi:F-type H+-transporting ATPase subunit epsilon
MRLKILLPSAVFADREDVLRIVAETSAGSFGLLPQRLDCVAALMPGLLMYETAGEGVVYLAVDGGVLVKTGGEVAVSVRHAIEGKDLGTLHEAVKQQFLTLNAGEQDAHAAVAKMEATLLSRFAELVHER